MAALNTKFTTYFGEFEAKMIAESSAHEKALSSIVTSFDEYGLTPEQKAEYTIQANIQALSAVLASATQSAIEIIKEEKNQDLVDGQISKLGAEKLLADAQALKVSADKDLVNQTKLTEVQQTLKVTAETSKIVADEALVAETELTQAQATLKTEQEVLKVTAETAKVTRDTQGYDDQMIMNMVTEQASVASFAVNADSLDAQTALDNLKCLMTQVLSRTTSLTGETSCVLTAP